VFASFSRFYRKIYLDKLKLNPSICASKKISIQKVSVQVAVNSSAPHLTAVHQ
jgi:hypothetical protein